MEAALSVCVLPTLLAILKKLLAGEIVQAVGPTEEAAIGLTVWTRYRLALGRISAL